MKRVRFFVIVAVAVFCLLRGDAMAMSCTLSVNSITFSNYGVYDVAPLQQEFSGVISFTGGGCDNPEIVLLGAGNDYDVANDTRRMEHTVTVGNFLKYNLYTSATYSTVWGDGSQPSDPGVGKNQDTNISVFGAVEASQDAIAGSYSDSVLVTINW